MNRKLFSIGLACLIALFLIPHFGHAQEKITGPWLWMIAPTEPEQGGAESIDIDSLAVASGGAVTEADVAANGANEGDRVGNYVWTLGQISATGGDNINECLNQIGLTDGNVDNHSSYALFTLNSETVRNGVTMHVGSDDAIKVWLNGVVVHNHPVNRGASDFQDAFPINLVAGDNLLMVKVSELGGGWSMFVGIDTATTYVGIDAVSGVSSDDGQIQDPDVRRPIVQVVYRPVPGSAPRPNVNAEIDGLIKKVQRFFADEMERHGFGRKTFQIEVDASGNSVVHRGELYNPGKNFFVYMEGGNQVQVQGICGYGGPSDWEGHAGHATIYCWDWKVVAHELGHAFGLPHDFRAGSDRYIMSYGGGARRQLSDGAAEWLDAHRAFNPATGKSATNERTKIEMLPPSFAAPPNAIRLRFKVNDTDGLHQAQLLTPTLTGLAAGSPELLNYKGLNGSTNTTVEFVTGLTPNNLSVSLLVIDVHSNFTIDEFPIDVTSLLPRSKGVSIPDANLAAAVRQTLRLSSSETITTHAMLNLSELDVSNSGITDLTGLEHAHNLRSLNLGNEFIEGDGFVNSRTVLDLSPLSGLTNLTSLQLSGNNISDIAAISALKNLDTLDLSSNNISDVSPLSGLTNLTSLNLSSNNISDLAALSTLTNLTSLGLSSNNISDVSPLSELAYLTSLWLSSNNISDVSPLSGLTNLTSLQIDSNTLSDISPLSALTNLTSLGLNSNNISDVSPLSELTQLIYLQLFGNNISDVSPLSELTQLTQLGLDSNTISDISPLLALNLTGTEWNSIGLYLGNNPLSYVSINTHIPTLQAKGIEINYTQRTPTTLLKVSGDAQQAVNNAELPLPFVVQVQDEYNRPFAEVPVTFAITEGSGKLSTLTAKTDIKGWAKVRFTLGQIEGETTIRATVPKISQPIHFTVTAIRPTAFVQLLDTNLTAKIAETLGKPTNTAITVVDMLTLTSLTANNTSINYLTGLQHASNLTTLMLDGNNLSNIDLLTGLTQLTTLSLDNNNLSDIAPLVELTQLKTLRLRGNLLSYPSLYTTIPTLRSRGVDVVVDTRTPTTLINVPGIPGVAGAARQVVVQVQDQKGIAFAGVPVNFNLAAAGRYSSTSKAITNLNGKATATLTLGPEPGENVVSATVSEISQPLTFTITAIDANTPVHIPDVNLHAKMAETLNKPKNETLKAGDLLELISLSAPNANIQNLSGLEYAHNLIYLDLGEEYISGEGWVNSSTVSDLSPLSGLTNLTSLKLDSNNISDVSALSELVYLTSLNLNGNNISDITPLSGLTNLTLLKLSSNNISDVSALSELVYLTLLNLSSNTISDITALSALRNLTWLNLSSNTISDITPLSGSTNLTSLHLWENTISDIAPLSGLKNLNTLNLDFNNISDITPLSELTQLTRLRIHSNNISDISPLLALNLTGTEWNSTGLYLWNNPLSYVSINTHIPAMQAKGVEIAFDNRAHSALVKISGDTQEGEGGTTLENPFVVEALDEHGVPITGLGVTFRVIEGEGHLSATTALTDADGKAQKTLTLGPNPGVIKVHGTAAGITSPVTFTATVTEVSRLAADVNGDGTVNIQDLVLVASSFGQNGQNRADVNGDGDVNIQDLVMVAGALGEGAAASPALHPSDLARLTAAQVQDLLTQARQMALTDPAYLRGIAVLEQLLALLQPRETALLPNYPNPFNPETWIPYQLAESAEVTIRIYAVDGSLVRTLSLGHKATGSYQTRTRAAHWDGRNQIGEPVASGVYFYTLSTESTRNSVTAGDFTATRKMLIRK